LQQSIRATARIFWRASTRELDANRNGVLAQLQESLPRAMAALQASGTALKEDLGQQGYGTSGPNFS
jgi:hypothetical protein